MVHRRQYKCNINIYLCIVQTKTAFIFTPRKQVDKNANTRNCVSNEQRRSHSQPWPWSRRGKVFRTKMFSRSYEFRSAAVLEGSTTIGRQVNRTIGIKGKGEAGSQPLDRNARDCKEHSNKCTTQMCFIF